MSMCVWQRVAACQSHSRVHCLNGSTMGQWSSWLLWGRTFTRSLLWISCLWTSFVIPNWVPYTPKPREVYLTCKWRGGGGTLPFFAKMLSGLKAKRGRVGAAAAQTEVCLIVQQKTEGSVWKPNTLYCAMDNKRALLWRLWAPQQKKCYGQFLFK